MSTAGPPQGANAPLGGGDARATGERGGKTHAPRTRVQRRPVHGVLLLDKPLGLSSNQALQKAKWLLRAEKAGHTGTLDPLATGVLPLCFGAATKFSQIHLDADKTYETVVRLGVKTSTADAEGDVIQTRDVACTPGQVVEVLDGFMGPVTQVPPMHSALKKDGKPLYEYARQGETVEREARHVVIHDLDLLDMQLQGEAPFLRLRVRCSKGTYIRTLGEDIAEALGCGGHLSMLRRIETGPFDASQCITLDALEALDESERVSLLLPVQTLLVGHQRVTLDADDAGRFLSGVRRRGDWADIERVAVFGPAPSADEETLPSQAVLLGSAHTLSGELIPGRLLSPIEIQQILETSPELAS
ncbi:MAG: tRNA pseudouridine(55) synthase TruB [Hydrogenophaga sp.]|uniref:tRNA pseudouridine(55) synthase TruB n=1 Tax=Hydrogenophaga sp. TaxID=1904254 RepID=UPI002616D675|nr:tRNA pseudouridine(55) synthase TruB [Hydrogenophaga sp.]MDM7944153.1 tRNA pseudouridine(55) synthase TruB [Hydrogenophaga sp.]